MQIKTEEKILSASMLLFSQKGYNAVTTKEIAKAAGVSEMSVFRHFACKHNLFEKAFDRFVFCPKYKALFESLEGDLKKDLAKLCISYQEALQKNQKIIFMYFKNVENPEFDATLFKFSNDFNEMLKSYFTEMKKRGDLQENPDTLALSFITLNFGLFATSLVMNKLVVDTDMQVCIESCVDIFVKGIRVN